MIRFWTSLSLLAFLWLPTQAKDPISFDFEVLPTLTRAGCNAGSCHGAAAGRGGFHLSLWGSNPSADHLAIARQFEGRRIDIQHPTESLLLKKPTGVLDHEGGAILDEDSLPWKILHDWIQQGGKRIQSRKLTQLELQFNHRTISVQSATILPVHSTGTLDVLAHFDTLEPSHINHLVTVTTPDTSGLHFDYGTMQLKALRPGIHAVIVRFNDQVLTLQILTPQAEPHLPTSMVEPNDANYAIDYWLDQRRLVMQQSAAPLADDATLLRRIMLDLTGRVPTPEQLKEYQEYRAFDKYEQLVDRLISTPQYIDFWTSRWTRTLGLRPNSNAPQGLHYFYQWLREQVAAGRPWDQVTREMLTATGDCHETSPAFFMLLANDPRQQAEQISRWFIGARMECANCHDHPLDRWKQDDYHGLAAVFARIERKRVVRWIDRGAVTNPRTGLPAIAQIPGGTRFTSAGDVRSELVQWMIEHPDKLLAKTIVNRVWAHFFGRGLVEPLDDMRLTNPATHPELLLALTNEFVSHHYDLSHLIRQIVLSNAYRRLAPSTTAESLNDLTYNFGPRKTLSSDVLLDMINDATGSQFPVSENERTERAIQLEDPTTPSMTLDNLGRCARSEACKTPSTTTSLTLMLHWINGETINARIADERHWLKTMLSQNCESRILLEQMYQRTLCRPPFDPERKRFLQTLDLTASTERDALWEDLFWALLSSKDFLDNR